MTNLQTRNEKKSYTMEDLCLYPFDRTLYMSPFPLYFETPKFEKYRVKGDPRDHIRQFFTTHMEVADEDTYLMYLFPKILRGQSLEWFSHLFLMITSWRELVEQFITNFSYNIDNPVTQMDLCDTKQREGESFASFMQRWCSLAR